MMDGKSILSQQVKEFLHAGSFTPLKLTMAQWKEIEKDAGLYNIIKEADAIEEKYFEKLEEIQRAI